MISHAKIFRHRRMFKTLTGLSTEGFKQMLPSFEEAWEANLDRRDAGRLRLRDRGGGRKGGFRGSADRLVFILVYFRLYPIQAVQGLLFGMSQPQASEWVHRLTPFLLACLQSYGCASSTVAPESRSSVASVTFIATSRQALRTPSSKPPADCTISGAASPSRHGLRWHEPRNRNGKIPRRLTRLFAIRSIVLRS